MREFLSTPSARRATLKSSRSCARCSDFYPRPPRGGRRSNRRNNDWYAGDFYPRPPRGGRQTLSQMTSLLTLFLSTPSARRATVQDIETGEVIQISIHALREEGDRLCISFWNRFGYFYPRPPRGGRPVPCMVFFVPLIFLSTPSARRATLRQAFQIQKLLISIHALREEGDQRTTYSEHRLDDFYPRPPRGGRPSAAGQHAEPDRFLSTPSARRATGALQKPHTRTADFYPRPPRGGRPSVWSDLQRVVQFLSTPSARRATNRAVRKRP